MDYFRTSLIVISVCYILVTLKMSYLAVKEVKYVIKYRDIPDVSKVIGAVAAWGGAFFIAGVLKVVL